MKDKYYVFFGIDKVEDDMSYLNYRVKDDDYVLDTKDEGKNFEDEKTFITEFDKKQIEQIKKDFPKMDIDDYLLLVKD